MARSKKATTTTTNKKQKEEVTYTISELAEAAGAVFQTSPDVVTAALKVKGVKRASLFEAKEIVKAYAKKEVK